jgi:hypothetical protein
LFSDRTIQNGAPGYKKLLKPVFTYLFIKKISAQSNKIDIKQTSGTQKLHTYVSHFLSK